MSAFASLTTVTRIAGPALPGISFAARLPAAICPIATLLMLTELDSIGTAGIAAGMLWTGQAVGGPFLGRLADRRGHRPVILAASLGPVTAALISNLPLEQAGAGSAVTNTVRQTGSVIGIAVGGTITSIVYRRAVEPSLEGAPAAVREQAAVSAEQARHIAATTHQPALARAADDAFIHAMHVGAGWTAAIALLGAVVLLITLPSATGTTSGPAPEPDREEARTSGPRAAA
ncbi:hypothetical protein [Streptomyces parvus]|uniref:hypothetical protein n=1 Tax=Streptomyces parvus TaxID=66428 RepID=UPI0034109B01